MGKFAVDNLLPKIEAILKGLVVEICLFAGADDGEAAPGIQQAGLRQRVGHASTALDTGQAARARLLGRIAPKVDADLTGEAVACEEAVPAATEVPDLVLEGIVAAKVRRRR